MAAVSHSKSEPTYVPGSCGSCLALENTIDSIWGPLREKMFVKLADMHPVYKAPLTVRGIGRLQAEALMERVQAERIKRKEATAHMAGDDIEYWVLKGPAATRRWCMFQTLQFTGCSCYGFDQLRVQPNGTAAAIWGDLSFIHSEGTKEFRMFFNTAIITSEAGEIVGPVVGQNNFSASKCWSGGDWDDSAAWLTAYPRQLVRETLATHQVAPFNGPSKYLFDQQPGNFWSKLYPNGDDGLDRLGHGPYSLPVPPGEAPPRPDLVPVPESVVPVMPEPCSGLECMVFNYLGHPVGGPLPLEHGPLLMPAPEPLPPFDGAGALPLPTSPQMPSPLIDPPEGIAPLQQRERSPEPSEPCFAKKRKRSGSHRKRELLVESSDDDTPKKLSAPTASSHARRVHGAAANAGGKEGRDPRHAALSVSCLHVLRLPHRALLNDQKKRQQYGCACTAFDSCKTCSFKYDVVAEVQHNFPHGFARAEANLREHNY